MIRERVSYSISVDGMEFERVALERKKKKERETGALFFLFLVKQEGDGL